MTKAELRKSVKISLQKALNCGKLNLKSDSERISNKIIKSDKFKSAEIILAYMSLPDEVNLSSVIKEAFLQNKKVAIPKCNLQNITMDFYFISKLEDNQTGSYGIIEPEEKKENQIDLTRIDSNVLFLIPGRAFTTNGFRLGRGKAYYDKYLAKIPEDKKNRVHLAGVCFPQQIVESLPVDEHDIKMNYVFY